MQAGDQILEMVDELTCRFEPSTYRIDFKFYKVRIIPFLTAVEEGVEVIEGSSRALVRECALP